MRQTVLVLALWSVLGLQVLWFGLPRPSTQLKPVQLLPLLHKNVSKPVGMIFFFHNPKAGGTWMRTVVQQYSFANVTTGTKTLSRDLGNLLEAKFHGQVILFHHHCEAIYMKRALPMVLEFKAKAQAAGFIFDIITSIREPVEHFRSLYNYAVDHFKPRDLRDFEYMLANTNNLQLSYNFLNQIGSVGDH